jgi:4-diphosphocytidyl-2-C-methyl-D-erythritol kinase
MQWSLTVLSAGCGNGFTLEVLTAVRGLFEDSPRLPRTAKIESVSMATRVRSYSKINLGLAIGPVRADGFHSLATLYQTLELHDVVTVEARLAPGSRLEVQGSKEGADVGHPGSGQSKITLTTNHALVPTDGRNTAWKIVARALERMGVRAEVQVHIEKELPVQGGLGAGSANAAAALIGLEQELGLTLPEPARLELAAEVGSDVPLFLVGGAVLGRGRGELVEAMQDLPATWCVVAVPEVRVSTPRAFQEWDQRQGPGIREQRTESAELTSLPQPDRLRELSHVYASVFGAGIPAEQASDPSGIVRGFNPEIKQDGLGKIPEQSDTRNDLAGNPLLALVRTGIENDFEEVVFPQYPLLREIKHELTGIPAGSFDEPGQDQPASGNAIYAALSGSGSALFGLYRSEADAIAAQRRVQTTGCKAILTRTLPRQEYWRKMFAE